MIYFELVSDRGGGRESHPMGFHHCGSRGGQEAGGGVHWNAPHIYWESRGSEGLFLRERGEEAAARYNPGTITQDVGSRSLYHWTLTADHLVTSVHVALHFKSNAKY